ncbi:thioredoxin family protein [Grimontia kaedaensis]|uniref:Thioredoxin family protein n=1 Tax=Grimontia kaedaensis TaxID=2872157 RepID=A0ABY4WU84_9GAMM|nr:protein-disulfide reductase DsbD domain-containing protein [Grimontia kaedaensis]USH03143.1 thioredoxin family protein [Grimontia kaedaensis]
MKNTSRFFKQAQWLIGILLLVVWAIVPAHAQTPDTGWLTNPAHPPVKARIALTGNANESTNAVEGFLEINLSGDWKTYWRSPGEGGIAPSLNWQASDNIKDVDWQWPAPQRFDLLGIDTLGYTGDIIFPITLYVDDINKPANFAGTLTVSSCTTVCVLTDYEFELAFTPENLTPNAELLHTHAQAASQVPKASPQLKNISAVWDDTKQQLQVSASKAVDWQSPDIIVDGSSDALTDVAFSVPTISVNGETVTATYSASSWMGKPALADEAIKLTFIDRDFLAEHEISAKAGTIVESVPDFSFASAIAFALLGGLILNIMPCVLPVLGLKLSTVITAQGLAKIQIRKQFLASAAGILFSFWLLAAFLLTLKLTGNAIGWGIQFQSPLFIGVMVAITTLFAANMLGLFEFRLPSSANTWLATRGDNSYVGHFTQGMFATLLATPCSTPFLGTAVAFALTASTPTLFAIFSALAVGMALPWLLVAAMPSLATKLPKPGAWMNRVKWLFGFMMLATSIWLLTLLANHLSLLWLIILSFIVIAFFITRTHKVHGKKTAVIVSGVGILLTAVTMVTASLTASKWVTPLPPDLAWQKLDESRIAQEVNAGNTVFVDVTADWCITCKANKIGVLLQEPVYSRLQAEDMVTFQGDWTSPNGYVTDYLRKYGRYGVPFNIVYGPAAPEGIPLPIVLSSEDVIRAINHAKGG